MEFKHIQDLLQNLTNAKISQDEIGKALGIGRSTVSLRVSRNSKLKLTEIKKLEEYFGVNLAVPYSIKGMDNPKNWLPGQETKAFEEYFGVSLSNKVFSHFTNKTKPYTRVGITGFGKRFNKIQAENDLNDIEMSKLLKISESRVEKLGLGMAVPTLDDLNSIKSNFDVSIDWLLYDE